MEGENGSERENKCKLTPRYEKTPGSRVPREEKPGQDQHSTLDRFMSQDLTERIMRCELVIITRHASLVTK